MRVHFNISTLNQIVPFDHQALLTGTIHKWLGPNLEHGKVSLYSFSNLEHGKQYRNGLLFESNSCFFFSSFDVNLIKQIINGVRNDPEMFHGLKVTDITIEEDPDIANKELFFLGSPILIKRFVDSREDHILYNDARANSCLKETLITKLQTAGINEDSFDIQFETSYPKAKFRLITYNGIKNKVSLCPVIIKGSLSIKQFIWNVGLGNSTGVGFGAIK